MSRQLCLSQAWIALAAKRPDQYLMSTSDLMSTGTAHGQQRGSIGLDVMSSFVAAADPGTLPNKCSLDGPPSQESAHPSLNMPMFKLNLERTLALKA